MQNIKILAIVSAILFILNPAIAQAPPVPMGLKKLQETQQQQPKVEIHEVRSQIQPKTEVTHPITETPQQVSKNLQKEQNVKASNKPPKAIKSTNNDNKLKNAVKNLQNKVKQPPKTKNEKPVKDTNKPETATEKQQSETSNISKQTSLTPDEGNKKPENSTASTNEVRPSQYNEIREQAKFLYNLNKLEDAEQLFNKIPDSEKISDDWLFLANIAQDKEKPLDAVFLLKKAIAADDNNYKAHYNLGNLYYYDNKINMAMSEYKKTLRLKKDFAYAYYNKGCCYLKKQSWFNARYEFGLAIKANPDEPAFYYNLAYTYKMMKKDKKAQEALEMYNKLMRQ